MMLNLRCYHSSRRALTWSQIQRSVFSNSEMRAIGSSFTGQKNLPPPSQSRLPKCRRFFFGVMPNRQKISYGATRTVSKRFDRN